MARNHNLSITLAYIKGDTGRLILRYTGDKKREQKLHLNFPVKHWDNIRYNVKQSHQSKYPELAKLIEKYKQSFPDIIDKLNRGTLHSANALDAVMGKATDRAHALSVPEFIEKQYKGDGTGNYTKYMSWYGGITYNLNQANYKIKELEVGMLSDESIVKDIARILRESPTVGNSASEYQKMLDRISRDAKLQKKNLFSELKLFSKKKAKYKKAVTTEELKMGIGKMNTYKQLEAFLFFLYSYCLKSMDGGNIVDLDESCLTIAEGKKLSHYHLLGDFIGCDDPKIDFSHKVRYFKPRNKEEDVPLDGVYNMFPILFIRDWLHYLIKLNRPELAYKGADRIRLFNFKINAGKVRSEEGAKKWKGIRDVYRDQTQKMFNASLQFARHTAGQNARAKEDLSQYDLDNVLGHKHSGVNKHYITGGEVARKDVHQMNIIEELDVVGILTMLYKSLRKRIGTKKQLTSDTVDINKHKPFKTHNENLLLGYGLLGFKMKADWTTKDEIKYQEQQSKLGKSTVVLDEFGMPVQRKNTIDDLSDEARAIINRKKEAFNIQAKVTMGIHNGKLRIYDAAPPKEKVEFTPEVVEMLKKEPNIIKK